MLEGNKERPNFSDILKRLGLAVPIAAMGFWADTLVTQVKPAQAGLSRTTSYAQVNDSEVPFVETPASPEVGSLIVEDSLTSPGILSEIISPLKRNQGTFTPDGYSIRVSGKSTETSVSALLEIPLNYLTIPDGKVSFEMRLQDGIDQTRFMVQYRARPDIKEGGYYFALEPARSLVQINKIVSGNADLLKQAEIPGVILADNADNWNQISLSLNGQNHSLIINNQEVLSVLDPTYDSGRLNFALRRLGDLNLEQPSEVLLRNLKVYGWTNSELTRLPTYQPPEIVAQPTQREFDPYTLEPGVVFDTPYRDGEKWLGDADSCIKSEQTYNSDPKELRCIVSQKIFPPNTEIVVSLKRRNIKPAEAKQGPGDRIGSRRFMYFGSERRQQGYGSYEVIRLTDTPVAMHYRGLPIGVQEIEYDINGSVKLIYRLHIR